MTILLTQQQANLCRYGLALAISLLIPESHAYAQSNGPDVIVGAVDNLVEWDRTNDGNVGLSASTDSCNVGNKKISWSALPSKEHPVIALNLYKKSNGRLIQVAQSWVKHGYFAVNANSCPNFNGVNFSCSNPVGGATLNPGCSDLYGAFLNADPVNLGPRSKINPSSGAFDGNDARDLSGYPNSTALERIMYMSADVLDSYANGKFYLESIYISADDAASGNAQNNVSFREFTPQLTSSGGWRFVNQSPMKLGVPAVSEWQGDLATMQQVVLNEEGGFTSSVYVGSKVIENSPGKFRYEYIVYNLNSDAAVHSIELPIGVDAISAGTNGFYAPKSHGEIWSNDPWAFAANGTTAGWGTQDSEVNPKANAIRWGTAYNFWFESNQAPIQGTLSLRRFKRSAIPAEFSANVYLPQK